MHSECVLLRKFLGLEMFSRLWNIKIYFAGQELLAPRSEVQNAPRSESGFQASHSKVSDFEVLHVLGF